MLLTRLVKENLFYFYCWSVLMSCYLENSTCPRLKYFIVSCVRLAIIVHALKENHNSVIVQEKRATIEIYIFHQFCDINITEKENVFFLKIKEKKERKEKLKKIFSFF